MVCYIAPKLHYIERAWLKKVQGKKYLQTLKKSFNQKYFILVISDANGIANTKSLMQFLKILKVCQINL